MRQHQSRLAVLLAVRDAAYVDFRVQGQGWMILLLVHLNSGELVRQVLEGIVVHGDRGDIVAVTDLLLLLGLIVRCNHDRV